MSFDLYQLITDRIIAQLEAGTVPWRKPWICSQGAISRSTGKPYSVLNQLLLPYDGEYVTFKQAIEEGYPVKKGEKASMVFFFKFLESEDKDTGEKKTVPLPLTLTVPQFCKQMNISRVVAYDMINSTGFPAFRVGTKYLINTRGLQQWINQQSKWKEE